MVSGLTNSEYAVAERRKYVAEQYIAGVPPALIYKEYKRIYSLSKHSFDKDITVARGELNYSVRDNYDAIVDNTLSDIESILALCLEGGDYRTGITAIKAKLDLLKLANPHKNSLKSVTVNQNNINLPAMDINEIRSLLGRKSEPETKHYSVDPE